MAVQSEPNAQHLVMRRANSMRGREPTKTGEFEIMYEAFDSFIRVETWQTRQPGDDERFHLALGKVVWSNNFDPDQMANYLRKEAEPAA